MEQTLIAGLILGIISSLHCIGMCGPIGLSLPTNGLTSSQRKIAFYVYHAGRISVYSALGLLFGLAGRGIYIAGFQQWLSICLGSLMVLSIIYFLVRRRNNRLVVFKRFFQTVQRYMIVALKNPSTKNFFLLGAANGLLPCGMVYAAIAGAITMGSIASSVLFMAAFGLGTLPALIGLRFAYSLITLNLRNTIRAASPYLIVLIGVLLILRGMNLGIPWISPMLPGERATAVVCHQ